MSSGTNTERITQNNGIITDNNTAIDNFKTAINNLPSRSPEINDFAELFDEYILQFKSLIDKIKKHTYPAYLSEPKTIYSPGSDYKYFVISKSNDSPSRYRIHWLDTEFVGVYRQQTDNTLNISTSILTNYNYNITNDDVSNVLNVSGLMNRIKFSQEFRTLNELLEAISSPNQGVVTYSSTSSMGPNTNYNNRLLITNTGGIIGKDYTILEQGIYSLSNDLTILPLE